MSAYKALQIFSHFYHCTTNILINLNIWSTTKATYLKRITSKLRNKRCRIWPFHMTIIPLLQSFMSCQNTDVTCFLPHKQTCHFIALYVYLVISDIQGQGRFIWNQSIINEYTCSLNVHDLRYSCAS